MTTKYKQTDASSKTLQLMCKDVIVAEQNMYTHTENVYRPDLLPFDYRNFEHFRTERLSAACSRMNIDRLYEILRYSPEYKMQDVLYLVSLTDTYWFRVATQAITWNDVSPYTHAFDERIRHFAITDAWNAKLHKSVISPEYTLNGSFKKCWCRHKDQIVLQKYGSDLYRNAGNEPYSELYCSQLAKVLQFKHYTPYTLHRHNNNTIFSECLLFTTEHIGLVDVDTLANEQHKHIQSYTEIFEWLKTLKIPYIEDDFPKMMLLDALTCNVDRHLGNIGVLYGTDNKRLIRLAPIYDNNLALFPFWDEQRETLANYLQRHIHADGTNDTVSRFGDDFVTLGKTFLTSTLRQRLQVLLAGNGFQFKTEGSYNLTKQRLDALSEFVREQACKILTTD